VNQLIYSITFTVAQISVISFLAVNTFPSLLSLPPSNQNNKPILVIVFLVLLSIVLKNLIVDFPTYCIMFSQQSSSYVYIDVLTPVFTLLFITYSFHENSDTFRCNKMHIAEII
jgi:hypothetical protein